MDDLKDLDFETPVVHVRRPYFTNTVCGIPYVAYQRINKPGMLIASPSQVNLVTCEACKERVLLT